MKRAKITLWILLSIIFMFLIISIIMDNENIFFIPLLIFFLSLIIFTVIEFKVLSIKIKQYLKIENYTDAIDYLSKALNKNYSFMNVYSCAITLVMIYMLEGDTDKAKYILEEYKKIKKNINLLYIQFIICISENRLDEAKEYQTKLLNLYSKKFNNQKASSVQIFEMIETKSFDQNLYNNTKYPLLKTICLRYSNDGIDKVEVIKTQQSKNTQTNQLNNKSVIVRQTSILLNILTLLTIFATALIINFLKWITYDAITSMDELYYGLKTIWVFWLLLPISLGCLLFGLIFKKKNYKTNSNIIIGIIFSVFLFLFGSMHFLGLRQFKTDAEYLINLGDIIQVQFPNDIEIITQDWTTGNQTSSDNNYYKYISVVKFKDAAEVLEFESSLNSDYWVDSFSQKTIDFLPLIFTMETSNYDKFLLYCQESKEYNPETTSSKYNYIYIAYSKEDQSLIIYEFTAK